MTTARASALAIRRTYSLGGACVDAVRAVDLRISSGETVAIVWPSGSGRTTLLLSLSRDDERRTVVLVTHDNDVASRAERILRMRDGRLVGGGDAPESAEPALVGSS